MPIIAFSHYNLQAPRQLLDRLRDFYTGVVGLTLGDRPPFDSFGYWLYAGDEAVLHLTESVRDEGGRVGVQTTFGHGAFNCTGRGDFEQALARHGVQYAVAQVPMTGQVQLFFRDPAGNGVELNFSAADA
jgi:catechol 2,3-dioxygenase-like lactoylglutathione lyase family enzyme